MRWSFGALTLLVGWQEGHPACKKWGDGGGGHWLVWMEWRPAGWSVSASVNLPLHHKVQKFSSGTGSPGWSQKKGCKMVVVVVILFCIQWSSLFLKLFTDVQVPTSSSTWFCLSLTLFHLLFYWYHVETFTEKIYIHEWPRFTRTRQSSKIHIADFNYLQNT